MGIPISFDVHEEDAVRNRLCTATDCPCPDCGQRRLIRLGAAVAHHQSRGGHRVPTGYIYMDLPGTPLRHTGPNTAVSHALAARDEGGEAWRSQEQGRGDVGGGRIDSDSRRQRHIQEWAVRMEGQDYYHDSDPEYRGRVGRGRTEEDESGSSEVGAVEEGRGHEWVGRRGGDDGGDRRIAVRS
ncbi:hypothetical protein BGZ99_003123 [Dissophora globulifera]|uniref:Uncharacterized protein n=1 Tax=Dissophora globulifera TaxID=979702 RepID=A0A9P6RQE4_9FUNG|nr:hypothetical protein BGZ99_003123 [Dissophora globulifera]